jgi:hypothetical protein
VIRVARKWIILAAVLAALVAAYAAAGFWLLPKILRSQATEFAVEKYGRQLELGEIRFNPFTLELVVDRFSFPDADGAPLASFDRLVVNLDVSSIWRAGASFREISIEKPYGRIVIRPSGELNLADLVKPFPRRRKARRSRRSLLDSLSSGSG